MNDIPKFLLGVLFALIFFAMAALWASSPDAEAMKSIVDAVEKVLSRQSE